MKINRWLTSLVLSLMAGFTMLPAQAMTPLWSFTPLTATTVAMGLGTTATVQYTITNNSSRSHTLVMTPITGVTQITGIGNCSNPFVLGGMGSCTLTLLVTANAVMGSILSGPVVCDQGSAFQCYQPSLEDSLNITVLTQPPLLSVSVSTLSLSVNNPTLNAALTGNPRSLTITNTGISAATNVNYSVSHALPAGASIAPANCGTILPGASCVLTITPGATPTTTAIVLTAQGNNTNSVSSNINILSYGSVYESGYVFSINDTTPTTGSVGGSVAALTDQSTGVLWSANSSGVYDGGVSIYGISQSSTTSTPNPSAGQIAGQTPCSGNANGACNSTNIVTWYSAPNTNPSISSSFYAAGLCKVAMGGFNDWYLPSICEEGYDTTSIGTGCGTAIAPTLQNMQSSLVDNPTASGLAGGHWSSTEYSNTPTSISWEQFFGSGSSLQTASAKSTTLAVRCVRLIT